MYGKVVDRGSTRRPGPYSTRSSSIKTSSSSNSKTNHVIDISDGRECICLDDTDAEDERKSARDFEPDDHVDASDDRIDMGYAANEDIWPEQFPAEFDLKTMDARVDSRAASVEENDSTDINAPLKAAPKLVAPEPEHCPGPESQSAGKGDACAGCPNQQICATAPKGPDPDIPLITARLASVKHKILVLSGKGGVGKSTFTTMLGHAFAANPEAQVGIMDTDICGPSIPKMMGVEQETIHVSNAGWSPVWVTENLGVMSVQFMLPNRDDAVIWRGPKKNGLIKQFLKDVEWGELDYLVVDTPPGTSDEHLSVNSFLKESGVDGAVVVTTPQEVSLLDVRKEIDFCRKAGIKVLGIVENMSGFVCPKCTHESQIFKATTGGARGLAKDMAIPFLGAVPLDPRIGMACDFGESFFDNFPDSPACNALRHVVRRVGEEMGVDTSYQED
ncbi:hypothetical protein QM012_001665 [Aureobasidium pullulans]|uniref:Cytosolic Fe-S cluster assembly factor NBP35 n=1 Tax=Aureobasidium pullulans TaxID=5580 RepID=A0ABR0TG68_AURPU